MNHMAGPVVEFTAMNATVGFALLFAAGFLVAWIYSPRLRARIEKPNRRFQKDARAYDESLKEFRRP